MKNGKYIDGIKTPARNIGELDERWKNNMSAQMIGLNPWAKTILVEDPVYGYIQHEQFVITGNLIAARDTLNKKYPTELNHTPVDKVRTA